MNEKTDEKPSGLSILVIEDSELYQGLIARTLAKEGHQCEAALDGESAIEKVKTGNYNMAFLDLKLPGKDGFEIHALLKEMSPGLKVVFITGHSSPETIARMKAANAFGYIIKPFELDSIRDIVSDIAGGSTAGTNEQIRKNTEEFLGNETSSASDEDGYDAEAAQNGEPLLKSPRFGRIGRWGGLITTEQLMECLAIQWETRESGRPARRLGEIMVGEGYLTKRQVNAVLKIQAARNSTQEESRFVKIALQNGFINKNQLKRCIATQERLTLHDGRPPLLEHIMMEKRYMSGIQVTEVLKVQSRKFDEGLLKRLESQAMSPTGRAAARWSHVRRTYPRLHACGLTGLLIVLIVFSFTTFRRMHLFEHKIRVIDESGKLHRVLSRNLASRSKELGEKLSYALYCEKCAVYFPLNFERLDGRKFQLKPCPECGKLDETELPG